MRVVFRALARRDEPQGRVEFMCGVLQPAVLVRELRQALPRERLRGLIAFLFACFGAGTPRYDDFVPTMAGQQVELAPEPVHRDAVWSSAYDVNPFEVPTEDKVALIVEWTRRMTAATRDIFARADVREFAAAMCASRIMQPCSNR